MLTNSKSIIKAPFAAFSWLVTKLFSQQGLALSGLLLAGVLAWGPWLRPPLSRDFRGTHIPWSVTVGSSLDPFDALETPRFRPLSSVGGTLLILISAGAAVVLVWPSSTVWVFGGLFVVSSAACAAVQFNQPALVEVLNVELVQREEMKRLFAVHHEDLLTGNSPDRTADLKDPKRVKNPIGFGAESAWRFQMFGPWLVGLAGVGFLTSISGSWRRRTVIALSGLVVSLACAGLVGGRRGVMQYHLFQAYAFEMNDDYTAASHALQGAVAAFPSLRDTRQYWLTTGRLAYRLDKSNSEVAYFRAHQLMLDKQLDDAVAILQPHANQADCPRSVRDLMADLISRKAWVAVRKGNPSAAEIQWRQAFTYAPWRHLEWAGVGIAMAMASPHQAERIEEWILPKMVQIGDRFVRADMASLVGDAYFLDGQFVKARQLYEQSRSIFSFPKYVNIHAQEGMLGM